MGKIGHPLKSFVLTLGMLGTLAVAGTPAQTVTPDRSTFFAETHSAEKTASDKTTMARFIMIP